MIQEFNPGPAPLPLPVPTDTLSLCFGAYVSHCHCASALMFLTVIAPWCLFPSLSPHISCKIPTRAHGGCMFVFVCFLLDFHSGIYTTYYSASPCSNLRIPGSLNSDPYRKPAWWLTRHSPTFSNSPRSMEQTPPLLFQKKVGYFSNSLTLGYVADALCC